MSQVVNLNYEFAGISDAASLHREIDSLRDQINIVSFQLATERELAMGVHRARSAAITESPSLRLVFGVDNDESSPKDKSKVSMEDLLSSAFVKKASTGTLPEGFADTVVKDLRTANHPDIGGDIEVSQDIAHSLAALAEDPTLSIANALLKNPKQKGDDLKSLRVEQYRLHIALASLEPQFESTEEAMSHAEKEIQGAEWRVRAQAAYKSFELITGGTAPWTRFMNEIVQTQHMYLINMVNRVMPTIYELLEQIDKGDPVSADALDIPAIDAIFERIWSTLGDQKDSPIAYTPPYQHWLEILLPALSMLDPGRKPGEEYTFFPQPIKIIRQPAYDGFREYERESKENRFDDYGYSKESYQKNYYDNDKSW